MGLDELRAEWDGPEKVGPGIMNEIRSLCAQTSKRYLAKTYSDNELAPTPEGQIWREHELDDLEAGAYTWLFEHDQFTYAFDLAGDLRHWRNVIALQIRHMLAHRSNKTVIDNHVLRARDILRDPPFQSEKIGEATWYGLGSPPIPDQEDLAALDHPEGILRSDGFEAGRRLVSLVPQREMGSDRGRERAHSVWNRPELTTCLEGIGKAYPRGFTLRHVDQIFRNVLTYFDTPGLVRDERQKSGEYSPDDESLENMLSDLHTADPYGSLTEQEALLLPSAHMILEGLDETDREILRRFSAGESQEKIGRDLGIGVRQTAAPRIDEVIETVRDRALQLRDTGISADELEDINDLVMNLLVAANAENGQSHE